MSAGGCEDVRDGDVIDGVFIVDEEAVFGGGVTSAIDLVAVAVLDGGAAHVSDLLVLRDGGGAVGGGHLLVVVVAAVFGDACFGGVGVAEVDGELFPPGSEPFVGIVDSGGIAADEVVVVCGVHFVGEVPLFHGGEASDLFGGGACFVKGREEDANEQCNNRDDDQQLDECECFIGWAHGIAPFGFLFMVGGC